MKNRLTFYVLLLLICAAPVGFAQPKGVVSNVVTQVEADFIGDNSTDTLVGRIISSDKPPGNGYARIPKTFQIDLRYGGKPQDFPTITVQRLTLESNRLEGDPIFKLEAIHLNGDDRIDFALSQHTEFQPEVLRLYQNDGQGNFSEFATYLSDKKALVEVDCRQRSPNGENDKVIVYSSFDLGTQREASDDYFLDYNSAFHSEPVEIKIERNWAGINKLKFIQNTYELELSISIREGFPAVIILTENVDANGKAVKNVRTSPQLQCSVRKGLLKTMRLK